MNTKAKNTQTTKERIIEAADDLFYQKGYEFTSFADIADEVNISRGNFYHHFKTKDDILGAVISHRIIKTKKMLKEWEEESQDAEERIRCFIHILIANYAKIKLYGCPVGTLTTELAKLDHTSQEDANQIFTLFRKCQNHRQTSLAQIGRLTRHIRAGDQCQARRLLAASI